MEVIVLEAISGEHEYTFTFDPGLLWALEGPRAERYVVWQVRQAAEYMKRKGVNLDTVKWSVRRVRPWEEQ